MKLFVWMLILYSSLYANTEFNVKLWLSYYYLNPQPQNFEQAIKILSYEGQLSNKRALSSMSAFFSEIFAQNELYVKDWLLQLKQLPEKERRIFILALYYSDIPHKYMHITKLIHTQKEKALLQRLKTIRFKNIKDMEIISITKLKMYWAAFKASGNEEYVLKIIEVLKYSKSTNRKLFSIAKSAKWSLTSNSHLHEKVKRICNNYLNKSINKNSIVYQSLFQILYGIQKK